MPNLRRFVRDNLRRVLPLITGRALSRPGAAPFDLLDASGLHAVCHTAWPEDPKLLADWDALSQRLPEATAFVSPVWEQAAWKVFNALDRCRLITVHAGARLLAVVPLAILEDGTLADPSHWLSDYLEPLIEPEAQADCWNAILSLLDRHWDRGCRQIVLHNIRETASCRTLLPQFSSQHRFTYSEQIIDHTPVVSLPGTFDEFLQTMENKEHKELLRKLEKAQTVGQLQFIRCEQPDKIAPSLELALTLMEACGGEKAQAVRKTLRPILQDAGPDMIRDNRLTLTTLAIAGQTSACFLHFPSPAGPLLYNFGYNRAQRVWSPGILGIALSIRHAIEDDHARTYDMLRGREPYKYKFGAIDRPLYRITLQRV